jgi:two-component system sensor histidine kinase/response regulator
MSEIRKPSILIIDDNPMNLLLASKVLEINNYDSTTAESGLEGIALIEKEIPSLILLDINMPEMDGYEVCRKIKEVEKWKEIPIIFLTAQIHTENLVEGFEAGGVDYITKPYKSEELLVRVKNHLELAESRRTILEMNRSRDKIYSIIAHDIRSPLSGILMTLDTIDQGYLDPNSEDFKEIIHQLKIRTKDTTTLLSSLLNWTRNQDMNVILHPKETNLNILIISCIQLLMDVAKNKNISILNEISENVNSWCDEVSINTVFRNIISNAIKFTPSDGSITITGKELDKSVEISITDTGIGMPEEAIRKIFGENQHYTSSGTENEQGTGLGLMLVKDFLKKNNGSLVVKSVLNEGTVFTVTLPKNKTN